MRKIEKKFIKLEFGGNYSYESYTFYGGGHESGYSVVSFVIGGWAPKLFFKNINSYRTQKKMF